MAESSIEEVTNNMWNAVKVNGQVPSPRVGQTALYLHKEHKVVVIGGATCTSLYNDVWILDLATLDCKCIEAVGEFEARYEHCAFLSADTRAVCIFGGANMSDIKNDLWQLSLQDHKWTKLSPDGEPPSARTYHTTSAVVAGSRMLVFGGGAKGPQAAQDDKVYQLDIDSNKWSILPTKGQPPKPRQGHAIVAVGNKLVVHGGMDGELLFEDLHVLEGDGTWVCVEDCGEERPPARAAHGAVHHDGYVYVFGGLGENRTALGDLWRLHSGTLLWQQVATCGPPPPSRLDCAMVVIRMLPSEGVCILLLGGINETGKVFDDFHMLSLRV